MSASWDHPTVFVNPPYGRNRERGTTIRDWLRKCSEAHSQHGAEVLALVPVATNTRHWKQFVFGAAASVAFLYDTRLRFPRKREERWQGRPNVMRDDLLGLHGMNALKRHLFALGL